MVYQRVNFFVVEDIVELSVHPLSKIIQIADFRIAVDFPQMADRVVVDTFQM